MFKGKFFQNFLIPALRGVVKSLPMGNAITEVVQNVQDANNKDAPILSKDLQHNYYSIITQILCVGAIIYAFYTHAITIDQLLNLLSFSK